MPPVWVDRITGERTECLQSPVLEGRYIRANQRPSAGPGEIGDGEPLVSDGREVRQIGDIEVSFCANDLAAENAARVALTVEAIKNIAGRSRTQDQLSISPLLAVNLDKEVESTALERLLLEVVESHSLRAIADSPRIEVEYTEEVTPIGRARRLPPRAAAHLASHSELWQQRTFTGVVPRQILARFSDDRYVTYENIVFARLLDRLERILNARLLRLNELRVSLEAGRDFQRGNQAHFHRLYDRVCELWGEVYRGDAAAEGLATAQNALDEISSLLASIKELKQGHLYAQIPREAEIHGTVQRTNLLAHDQHYRHLPRLWDATAANQAKSVTTSAEVIQQKVQLQIDYSAYVGVVLTRALEKCIATGWPARILGNHVRIEKSGLEWLLRGHLNRVLRIVSIACWSSALSESTLPEDTLVCCPELAELTDPNGASTSTCLRASPLDLYVVERLGLAIDRWISQCIASEYAKPVAKVPMAVSDAVRRIGGRATLVTGSTITVFAAVAADDRDRIFDVARRTCSSQTISNLTDAFSIAEAISICPECGQLGILEPQNQSTFWASCRDPSCRSSWGIQVSHGRRQFLLAPKVFKAEPGFESTGRSMFSAFLK